MNGRISTLASIIRILTDLLDSNHTVQRTANPPAFSFFYTSFNDKLSFLSIACTNIFFLHFCHWKCDICVNVSQSIACRLLVTNIFKILLKSSLRSSAVPRGCELSESKVHKFPRDVRKKFRPAKISIAPIISLVFFHELIGSAVLCR